MRAEPRHRGLLALQRTIQRGKAHAWAQPVTYLGVAMLVVIFGILALLIVNDRREAENVARRQGDNLVRIIEESYSHIFQSVDATLLFLRKSYLEKPEGFDVAGWIESASAKNALTFNFVILDAKGKAIAATYVNRKLADRQIIGTDFSERDYFQYHVASGPDELFISAPLQLKVSGTTAIVLSRRLTAPDGTFGGLVAALVNPNELGKAAAGLDLGPNGTFGLVGRNGVVRTRIADGKVDVGAAGRQLPPDAGLLSNALRAPSGVFWNSPELTDGVSRLVSYRALDHFPLIAFVAVAEREIFRHANQEAGVYSGIALLLTVGILIAIGSGMARERKLKDTMDDLKRAQETARRGEERYRLVEAAVNDGIWDWNIAAATDYRSPRWNAIVGCSDGDTETLTSSFRELVHPDDKARVADAIRAHLIDDKPYDLEFRLRHKDGDYRWVRSRGKAIRDAEGLPVRMLGTMSDISEQKRAEAAINESRENLARAEAMALLGHTRTDRNGAYTWSAGLYRMMGKSPQTYTPTPDGALALIHPDDRAAHIQYRRDAMAGVDVPRKIVRMIRDDGRIIDVEFWSAPIRDKDGFVIGKFSTLQDVTALRRTEALMNESHSNLKRAEAMAQLGHYKYDTASDTVTWSEGIYRIFELSPASFTPTLETALQLYHPADRPKLEQYRRDLLAGIEQAPLTLRVARTDGRAKEIELWSAPVRDAEGRITGMFGTVQDVTIRKRAEEALARANQELEVRVSERTAELAHEMRRREEAQMTLGQMQKMEAVGQLTAGIAHDFNNLLAVIGGSLEFVDRAAARGLTAEPELIDAALRATRRGRELVRRLLAFSRQTPLRAEPTAIDQLVLDTLRLLQRTLGQGIDMVTRLDGKAAVISVDRNQMANALLNLALNARDAMPDGGQLTIATTCRPVNGSKDPTRSATGEEVVITISDTGLGMTDDVRSRAFEPFFTTKPDGLGSGLGLSMVQGFVEQSGGKIDIQSALGKGTSITIRLPRIACESRADEADTAAGAPVTGREKTVLLVEDDPDVRVVTTAQLRHLGYKVHAVGTGMEAIDLIASPANIDITLTDIVLPGGLDGVALVKEAMRARPTMGVLCMSGYNPAEKHRKWLQVQNINFLEKPFSSVKLAQALDAALAH